MIKKTIFIISGISFLWIGSPVNIYAHGFGERYDLPIPLSFFLIGAGLTIIFSFLLLLLFYNQKEKINDFKAPIILNQNTTFPQIHSNLNGMVREFVRSMHQDKKGNYWFGTNGDGIIRYDGQTLEKITIAGISPHYRVLEIVEDTTGNLWFGTSEGLISYRFK